MIKKKIIKIGVIFGTRPEIIKLASVIKLIEKTQNVDYFLVHTRQHFDKNMSAIFLRDLNLPKPDYSLKLNKKISFSRRLPLLIRSLENILLKEKPDICVVQGDTDSTLAGAIAAFKNKIKIAHIEAGLRSYDRTMPEETNRVIVDNLSDFLFAPTEVIKDNLISEGIESSKILITGNTIVDAVYLYLDKIEKEKKILDKLKLKGKNFILVTIHRIENLNNKIRLIGILKGLKMIKDKFNIPIILPIHPHTKNKIKSYGLQSFLRNFKVTLPLDYFKFLLLEREALIVLTDSGGAQEETCILKTPCITLRDNTERPETLKIGCNILAGTEPEKIFECFEKMLELKDKIKWKNPYGDGLASYRIINHLFNNL